VARQLGDAPDSSFWRAAFAVQLAHEASLVHDDVVDGAVERRGAPTVVARSGVGTAVVVGDHLLTAGYRFAAETRNADYARLYAEAVERTVAGEIAQARARKRRLTPASYREIVRAKSGELLGLAAATPAVLSGSPRAEELRRLGRALGVLYQMLDDLLDYCPGAGTGKAALRDHTQSHWTWLLDEMQEDVFGLPVASVLHRLHEPGGDGLTPLRRAAARYAEEVSEFLAMHQAVLPGDTVIPALTRGWQARVEQTIAREEVLRLASALSEDDVELARHSRSFRFAARFFPAADRRRVAAVYTFCRFTDDLVDRAGYAPAHVLEQRLDAWLDLARACYQGERTGVGFLDRSVGIMRPAEVPFDCVTELIAGVRMDLSQTRYETMSELRRYSHGVASSVGAWLTHLFGVHDAWTLRRAAALGRAMQLTNILRDVGEDLDRGRLYVPREILDRFAVTEGDLAAMRAGAPVQAAWRDLVEHLIAEADADYESALQALGRLPRTFRVPVAVAAHVYRGIHDGIRANGYDAFTRRAHTTGLEKLRLAAAALGRSFAVPGRAPVPITSALVAALLCAPAAHAQGPALRPPRATQAAGPIADSGPVSDDGGQGVSSASGVQTLDSAAVAPPLPPEGGARTAIERLREIESRLRDRPESAALGLDRARALYFVGVDDETAAGEGLAQVELLRGLGEVPEPLLNAYQGAFETLRAKHAFWPVTKLRRVRAGLALLDRAAAAAPDLAEIRYLRLMGGFYLPSLFGRRDVVEEDLEALERLLLEGRRDPPRGLHTLPPELHRVIVDFLLKHAELTELDAARLSGAGPGG
jgi:phytoene synthase